MATTVTTRSYLIAGMAAISAGAIAVAPMHPISGDLTVAPEQVRSLAVGLAASIDPITPWIDTFQTAADNIGGLFTAWAAEPFPIITQIITNQLAYLSILPDIPAIISQVISNIGSAVQAPFQADINTLDPAHQGLYTLLPLVAPTFPQVVLDLLTTSTLGIVGGLLGPVLAPVIAVVNSVQSIIGNLGSGDFIGALNDLINIPANLVNAFLNGGQTLDLTGLLGPLLPDNVTLNSAGLVLGGVLAQGASLFNALGLDVSAQLAPPPFPPVNVAVPGNPGGIFGSLIAFTKAIASAIEVVPPPNASVAKVAAAEVTALEAETEVAALPAEEAAPEAVAATSEAPEAVAFDATADDAAAEVEVTAEAPEVTTTAVDAVKRGGDGATSGARDIRGKGGRGDNGSAGQDAPKRSAAKAGASRG